MKEESWEERKGAAKHNKKKERKERKKKIQILPHDDKYTLFNSFIPWFQ